MNALYKEIIMKQNKETEIDTKLKLEIIPISQLTPQQIKQVKALQSQSFADIEPEAIEEDFIAEGYARVIAILDDQIVGTLQLFHRFVRFKDKLINLGGLGGICVQSEKRRQGIATKMITAGLDDLYARVCDVACLNADINKGIYQLYEKVGFALMERPISFEDANGKVKEDTGTMFIPLNSKEIFKDIMNSSETFHYGRGYW